jgi:regulation of enolase protein 1 (concanavalin A-like superfamily)
MLWFEEPPVWRDDAGVLTMTTAPKSDFWRKTHYGFIRDNGHFYYEEMADDFVATVQVVGEYTTLYDQAGLMVRVDTENWMKCGIEFVEGIYFASAVVTRDFSDWSVASLGTELTRVWLRVVREGTTLTVEYSLNGEDYILLRNCYLPMEGSVQVGPMAASPGDQGFDVRFEGLEIIKK